MVCGGGVCLGVGGTRGGVLSIAAQAKQCVSADMAWVPAGD